MTENHDLTSSSEFICEFGSVRMDKPFSEQPDVQKFLDVSFAQEGRLVSDEFLFRLLEIVECIIQKSLSTLDLKQALVSLYLGYESWKALPPDANHHDRMLEDLEEAAWVNIGKESNTTAPDFSPDSIITPVISQLMERCQEETLRRINSEVLEGKSFYVLIYGNTELSEESGFAPLPAFGVSSCRCDTTTEPPKGYKGKSCTERC